MLSRNFISAHPDEVKRAVEQRCDTAPIDDIVRLIAEQRALIDQSDRLKSERRSASRSFKDLTPEQREELRARGKTLGDEIAQLDARIAELEEKIHELELWVPNVPDPSVPLGTTEEDNVVRWSWGERPEFGFEPRSHADIGEALGIFDPDDAVRMSGTRFYALKGVGARMEYALASLMLDMHRKEHGFEQCWIPYAVKSDAMILSAQLPRFAEDAYYLEKEDMYLIPTGEVPLVNMEAGKILEDSALPILYTAVSPCFRREAGAAGRETRGMIRVHQFDKVEMVVFCRPEESMEWLERLVKYAENVLQRLELPYHVLEMNTSDLGFGQVKKYDPEVWMPSLNRYVEISSCSNMGDFQARRGKIRYRPGPGEPTRLVHTLNGSGLAVGRCMAAVLENYQQEDGSVRIPDALAPYLGGITELRAS